MTQAEFYRSEPRKSYAAALLRRCRYQIASIVRRSMSRDSWYFLVAALSLAVVIGWLSFVTIAARA
jgi:hypothetical protein